MSMIGQMEDAGAHNKNITATKEGQHVPQDSGALSPGTICSCPLVPATRKTTVARDHKSSRPVLLYKPGQKCTVISVKMDEHGI